MNNTTTFHKMPIVSALTDKVLGFEILLKSFRGIPLNTFNQHPELYSEFSFQLLKEIFHLDQQKKLRGISELLYLNLTPDQFLSHGTLEFLYYLHESKYRLENLVIEFTEHDLHCDLIRIKERILLFKQHNCQFAIDDFGIKVSNFQRVFEINTEFIKVDRGLITRSENNQANQDALTELVSFCHKLNKKVIVEGIETKTQFEQAKVCGADYLQGYFFSLPELIV